MKDFILPALSSGIPLYAVWMFTAPVLNLLAAKRGFKPGRARSMLAAGAILIILSASNVEFGSTEAMAHLAGILLVAPLLAVITYYFLERREKSKPGASL